MDGDIQLVDGRNVYEGRVEVCQDGLWGFVCDNSWTKTSGLVACRQAGINATGLHFSQLASPVVSMQQTYPSPDMI